MVKRTAASDASDDDDLDAFYDPPSPYYPKRKKLKAPSEEHHEAERITTPTEATKPTFLEFKWPDWVSNVDDQVVWSKYFPYGKVVHTEKGPVLGMLYWTASTTKKALMHVCVPGEHYDQEDIDAAVAVFKQN